MPSDKQIAADMFKAVQPAVVAGIEDLAALGLPEAWQLKVMECVALRMLAHFEAHADNVRAVSGMGKLQ